MCYGIEKVFNLALATFSRKNPSDIAQQYKVDALVEQINKITAVDVGLDLSTSLQSSMSPKNTNDRLSQQEAPVTYIPVSENKDVSIGVFIIKEGQGIPLHDHPHMFGILKCLVGKLKITSMTRKEGSPGILPDKIRKSPQMLQKMRYGGLFIAEQASQVYLTPEAEGCALVEPKCNNIHRVESVGGPAAFLDILAPPYNIDPSGNSFDKQERDCHYFREVAEAPGPPGGPPRKWLLMSDPPESFFCDTEPYRGPKFPNRHPNDNNSV